MIKNAPLIIELLLSWLLSTCRLVWDQVKHQSFSLVWKLQPQHSVSRPRGKTKKGRKKKNNSPNCESGTRRHTFPCLFQIQIAFLACNYHEMEKGKTGIRQTTPTRYFRRNWKWATARQSNQLVYTYTKAFTRITLERCAHTTSGVEAYYTPWPEM